MIESFVKWIEGNQQKLVEKKVFVSVRRDKKRDNLPFFTATIAEFETDKIGGSIILYYTGQCDIDVFSNDEKQEEIFIESHEPESEDELYNLLESTFDKIVSY